VLSIGFIIGVLLLYVRSMGLWVYGLSMGSVKSQKCEFMAVLLIASLIYIEPVVNGSV